MLAMTNSTKEWSHEFHVLLIFSRQQLKSEVALWIGWKAKISWQCPIPTSLGVWFWADMTRSKTRIKWPLTWLSLSILFLRIVITRCKVFQGIRNKNTWLLINLVVIHPKQNRQTLKYINTTHIYKCNWRLLRNTQISQLTWTSIRLA